MLYIAINSTRSDAFATDWIVLLGACSGQARASIITRRSGFGEFLPGNPRLPLFSDARWLLFDLFHEGLEVRPATERVEVGISLKSLRGNETLRRRRT